MISFIHDVFNIADRYGLKILNIDTTDVTLMVKIGILPTMPIRLAQVGALGYDPAYVRLPSDYVGVSAFFP